MRLLKVKNPQGNDFFINPACIEAVGRDTDGQTKIYMRGDNYYTTTSVKDVARMIEGNHDKDESNKLAPVNPWRVLATALKLLNDVSYDVDRKQSDRLRAECAVAAIIAFNEDDIKAEPLETTTPL